MQRLSYLIIISIIFSMCQTSVKEDLTKIENELVTPSLEEPEWTKNANIYEVNIRQYSPEGTFNAFMSHLPRLKEMGVDILWLMPIHPIGLTKRKGGLGSPYSIKDYKALNPDMGTAQEFKNLIAEAHALGFKVILDWVANHSSFDNDWVIEHPEWYTKDEKGNVIHPKDTDWTDVADLNFDNMDMRKAMVEAMTYWIREYDIDGFRCDVAGFVPHSFWKEAIRSIQKIKHIFILAEWDEYEMHDDGFHMTYGWGFHHIINEVSKRKKPITSINEFILEDQKKYKTKDYRMNFTTNHDENSWNGTVEERLGPLGDAMAVLAFTIQGMPLLYSGQEAGLNKRLSFFENDSINWSDISKEMFFTKLLRLKHDNEALWNGKYGGSYQRINTSDDDNIFAYERTKENKKVIVILNLSKSNTTTEFNLIDYSENRKFTNIFTDEKVDFSEEHKFNLRSGEYIVLSN